MKQMLEAPYKIDSDKVQANLLAALEFILGHTGYSDFLELDALQDPNLTVGQFASLNSAYFKLKYSSPKDYSSNIPQIEIPFSSKKLSHYNPSIIVGGNINCSGGEVKHSSFSLCVAIDPDISVQPNTVANTSVSSCCLSNFGHDKIIARRFHFDHQPCEERHPPSHVQYGGNFPGMRLAAKKWHYCLDNSIDNPRLSFFPMDFVLVLDIAVRDFDTYLSSLANEPDWNELVQKSQQIWWREYLNWLNTNICDGNDRIFHDIIYS